MCHVFSDETVASKSMSVHLKTITQKFELATTINCLFKMYTT